MSRIDVSAVAAGAGVGLVVILPVVVVARLSVDDAGSTAQSVFVAVILAATLVGTIVAARREPGAPLLHGALTGLSIFVVAQLISSVLSASVPNPVAIVFFALVFMSLGTIGGLVAGFRRGGSVRGSPS